MSHLLNIMLCVTHLPVGLGRESLVFPHKKFNDEVNNRTMNRLFTARKLTSSII